MLGHNELGTGESRGLYDLFGGQFEDDASACSHSVWLATQFRQEE